jgi:RNA 2',3'-cyclic 3'-phosphodiesterase
MRLFVALDLEEGIRERIRTLMDGVRGFAPDARWVRPESLHVTLKFIGERTAEVIGQIRTALSSIKTEPVTMKFAGHGFFPTAKSARVFWIGIEGGEPLVRLATSVDEALSRIGIAREDHVFSPHLTLARGGRGSGAPQRQKNDSPNRNFQRLQEKLAALPSPEFGTMTANEYFLFESELGRGGSRYKKIARFSLS